MPDFMTLLSKHNAERGVTLTFSELKKTARRIERDYNQREERRKEEEISADEYLRIIYADPTPEEAIENIAAEQAVNAACAARRAAGKAAA